MHLYNKARTDDKDVIVYDELMHDLHNESGTKAKVWSVRDWHMTIFLRI